MCASGSSSPKTPGDSLRSTTGVLAVPKDLEQQYRFLQKSPFTSTHVLPFFEAVISQALPQQFQKIFEQIRELFWHQLYDLLQMKAILVDPIRRNTQITRLDISTTLKPAGLDELRFENDVDGRMNDSCRNALLAARSFLELKFSRELGDRSLLVECRFPNPAIAYQDASASLLVGLKIVGDVLDLEINPAALVSGEVDSSGKIRPVQYVMEKIIAADAEPDVRTLFLPQDGRFLNGSLVTIRRVRNFGDAVCSYFGERYARKVRQLSRRQILERAIDFSKKLPQKRRFSFVLMLSENSE